MAVVECGMLVEVDPLVLPPFSFTAITSAPFGDPASATIHP